MTWSGRATSLEIERAALKREKDAGSKERLEVVERELAEVKEKAAGLRARWQKERGAIGKIAELKEQLEGAAVPDAGGDAQGQSAARCGVAVWRDSEAGGGAA